MKIGGTKGHHLHNRNMQAKRGLRLCETQKLPSQAELLLPQVPSSLPYYVWTSQSSSPWTAVMQIWLFKPAAGLIHFLLHVK
ncbi:MAG: hypothetical protein LBV41_02295 [Cytophagaceae bacterium]|nr:hypothetical protein [Cytophagaceae bacterium]